MCVVRQMVDERGIGGCLTAETPSRPYFDTLAEREINSLCESNCEPLIESDDVRQRMINYHRAVAMDDVDLSNGQETLPTSLYLWAGYHQRLKSTPELAHKHRRLALAVDDVWLYPWTKGVALMEEGRVAYEAGQFETADAMLTTSITALDISDPIGDQLRSQVWFLRGQVALAQDDVPFARTAIAEAITLDPENATYLSFEIQLKQDGGQ